MELSKTLEALNLLFDKANEKWYNGSLPKPVIIVQSSGKKSAYGWCSINKIWKNANSENSESQYEITICAEYLSRTKQEVFSTMLHEMVHLYNLENNVKDTTNNFTYHNKRFKFEAEKRGLTISHNQKLGWSITELNEEAKAFIDSITLDTSVFSYARAKMPKLVASKPNPYATFECGCGRRVKSSELKNPEEGDFLVDVVCTLCDSKFYFVVPKRGRKARSE